MKKIKDLNINYSGLLLKLNPRVLSYAETPFLLAEFKNLNVHPCGIKKMLPRSSTLCLKLHNISPTQAYILKQEFLANKGEAAISMNIIKGGTKKSNVILIGTPEVFHTVCQKLKPQPFNLPLIGKVIHNTISSFLSPQTFTRAWSLPSGKRLNIAPHKTLIMGILNITPDSFSDGNKYFSIDTAMERINQMIKAGVDIIDIGGESTRPGAKRLSVQQELNRILPLLKFLKKKNIPIPVSIDTYKAEVANKAIKLCADIINDVSALRMDKNMVNIAKRYNCPIVLMHMKGIPKTMQKNPTYNNLIHEITLFLRKRITYAISNGINPKNIIIDPGIGFGKTFEHNLEIITRLHEFKSLACPLLLGASRKSFIGHILNIPPHQRVYGTLAITAITSFLSNAHIIRIHDIHENIDIIKVVNALNKFKYDK